MAEILLRFKFPDGSTGRVNTAVEFTPQSSVEAVRSAAAAAWPPSLGTIDQRRLRLVCMGKPWDDDAMTLAEVGAPRYSWPTPVHVIARGEPRRAASPVAVAGVKAGACGAFLRGVQSA